jgi:hypothetical protein
MYYNYYSYLVNNFVGSLQSINIKDLNGICLALGVSIVNRSVTPEIGLVGGKIIFSGH